MRFARVLVVGCGLLLSSRAAHAQQTTAPKPVAPKPAAPTQAPAPRREQRVLTVNLPLPKLVARLGELTGLLERPSTDKKRRAAGADAPVPDDPVLILTLPLPKLFSIKPDPATP